MSLIYRFPKLYQYMLDNFFPYIHNDSLHPRETTFALNHLNSGSVVLDLACGEGGLTFWLAQQRSDVHIFGVDSSDDMLNLARQKAQKLGLENISFINKPVIELTTNDLVNNVPVFQNKTPYFDMIVCSFGFSAMPDYEQVFRHTLTLLVEGGTYVIKDLYYPKRTVVTWLATHIVDDPLFGANQFRKPFLLMQSQLADFVIDEKPVFDYGLAPGLYYVARGTKKP